MSGVPAELKYTKEHEWVRLERDGSVVVGITDHAQHQLGELVFIELPEPARTVTAGEACAVVESVKAASDVYAPVSGTVMAVNEALVRDPGLVNTSPYGEGWLLRLKPSAAAPTGLLDAAAYTQLLDDES
jgi:glycine cleavage system H protein